MKISSPEFPNNGTIPDKYTCRGEGINPPLMIEGVPETAKSLLLIVDDPDAPAGLWTHWTVWNIDPGTAEIQENSIPMNAVQGNNTSGTLGWESPCPPSGTHRYFFKLYALDTMPGLPSGSQRAEVAKIMEGHIVAQAEYIGLVSN